MVSLDQAKKQVFTNFTFNLMKTTIYLLAFILLPFVGFSQQKDTTFLVNGVCELCQKTIEKAASIKGVKAAQWDVKTKTLRLSYNPEKVTLAAIEQAVVKSGYDTEFNMAKEEDYQALHACCHYRDEEVINAHKEE